MYTTALIHIMYTHKHTHSFSMLKLRTQRGVKLDNSRRINTDSKEAKLEVTFFFLYEDKVYIYGQCWAIMDIPQGRSLCVAEWRRPSLLSLNKLKARLPLP